MSKEIRQYDLLISCPGDIRELELSAIDTAVNKFNESYEDIMGKPFYITTPIRRRPFMKV